MAASAQRGVGGAREDGADVCVLRVAGAGEGRGRGRARGGAVEEGVAEVAASKLATTPERIAMPIVPHPVRGG